MNIPEIFQGKIYCHNKIRRGYLFPDSRDCEKKSVNKILL